MLDEVNSEKQAAIVGAGPAGLFACELLLKAGFQVDLYDGQSGPGKKFLVAGKSGLNLTNAEDPLKFIKKYGKCQEFFNSLLEDFSPEDMKTWCQDLGVEVFVGSSGRVFPVKMKASEILISWVERLRTYPGFEIHLNHQWVGFENPNTLVFKVEENTKRVPVENCLFALGGGSWPQTGSDGSWVPVFRNMGISVLPLKPTNCGFEVNWSKFCEEKFQHIPLKNIGVQYGNEFIRGDLVLTPYGVESGPIYALSEKLCRKIEKRGGVQIHLDLKPDLTVEQIQSKLKGSKNAKQSLSNHIRKALGLGSSAFTLLKEVASQSLERDQLGDFLALASLIKNVPLKLKSPRPLEEAISSSGGVAFSELNESLMLHGFPGFYVVGEMLDWEAPTGGYLLQGCFSTAFRAAQSVIKRAP